MGKAGKQTWWDDRDRVQLGQPGWDQNGTSGRGWGCLRRYVRPPGQGVISRASRGGGEARDSRPWQWSMSRYHFAMKAYSMARSTSEYDLLPRPIRARARLRCTRRGRLARARLPVPCWHSGASFLVSWQITASARVGDATIRADGTHGHVGERSAPQSSAVAAAATWSDPRGRQPTAGRSAGCSKRTPVILLLLMASTRKGNQTSSSRPRMRVLATRAHR